MIAELILAAEVEKPAIMECKPQKPHGAKAYWSWRIIEGRTCWYPGYTVKPKYELRWGKPASSAPPEKGVEPTEVPLTDVRLPPTLLFEDRWKGIELCNQLINGAWDCRLLQP
jgi:hypothetical protein